MESEKKVSPILLRRRFVTKECSRFSKIDYLFCFKKKKTITTFFGKKILRKKKYLQKSMWTMIPTHLILPNWTMILKLKANSEQILKYLKKS